MTFEIFHGSTFDLIHKDNCDFQQIVAHWQWFATDVLVEYIKTQTEKIGGPGKIAEINESKIWKMKFNRSHFIDEQ